MSNYFEDDVVKRNDKATRKESRFKRGFFQSGRFEFMVWGFSLCHPQKCHFGILITLN